MIRRSGCGTGRSWLVVALVAVIGFGALTLANAEEQRDLREGITGEYSTEKEIGVLPRFKVNPDTGVGSGLKLKADNLFGGPMVLDLANIYTTNQYQIYELLFMLPRIGGGDDYWYFMMYLEFDRIPDLRIFGAGNDTSNHMYDPEDDEVGDEATVEYVNVTQRFTAGRKLGGDYYVALEKFYRQVWVGEGDNDDLPQAQEVYAGLPGMEEGAAAGLGLALIRSTRDHQWRPTEGSRFEIFAEDTGPYFGSDYDYTRYLGDLRAYFLLFGDYNVLAFHARAEALEGKTGDIPWWAMPYIGGRDSLRGYWEGRFRGKGSMMTNTEFRYHIYHIDTKLGKVPIDFVVDGNLFFDSGRVFTSGESWRESFDKEWKYAGGFGFRFTTPPNLMGRVDFGFSREERFSTYFNFGTVF